jgi:hypothetical protein
MASCMITSAATAQLPAPPSCNCCQPVLPPARQSPACSPTTHGPPAPPPRYEDDISLYRDNLVAASLEVYSAAVQELLPTPAKTHYTFNLRDLSKVFQGMQVGGAATPTAPWTGCAASCQYDISC